MQGTEKKKFAMGFLTKIFIVFFFLFSYYFILKFKGIEKLGQPTRKVN